MALAYLAAKVLTDSAEYKEPKGKHKDRYK